MSSTMGDVTVGGRLKGNDVLAVHYQESHGMAGVVLTWDDHQREYVVWNLDRHDRIRGGKYTFDLDVALLEYATRVTEHMFTHYNKMAPRLTFG